MKIEYGEREQLLMKIQVRHETIRMLYDANDADLKRLAVIEEAKKRENEIYPDEL